MKRTVMCLISLLLPLSACQPQTPAIPSSSTTPTNDGTILMPGRKQLSRPGKVMVSSSRNWIHSR
ncbi:MAG TPA: hypothetical protein VFO91_02055, partial [Anaerolineales bacterium]|nr:hypothetical protein [Anaerolineales bacterium]